MKKTIFLASQNPDKVREISEILDDFKVYIKTVAEFPDIKAPAETGMTFRDNAMLKARYYHSQTGSAVIADDSGLVVPALDGEPGIYSARYSGKNSDYKANNNKLLKKMSPFVGKQRQAYFVAYAVYFDGINCIEAEGRVYGLINDRERGNGGFGYDPVFLLPELNKTFAELDAQEKNRLSHRSKALKLLHKKLQETSIFY
jgi:XTP/dITP diphosphohydrolase